jgi:hypothetical protein
MFDGSMQIHAYVYISNQVKPAGQVSVYPVTRPLPGPPPLTEANYWTQYSVVRDQTNLAYYWTIPADPSIEFSSLYSLNKIYGSRQKGKVPRSRSVPLNSHAREWFSDRSSSLK